MAWYQNPAWILVLIAAIGGMGTIIIQFVMAGKYLERVDQLMVRVEENKRDANQKIMDLRRESQHSYDLISDKVETLVTSMGIFNTSVGKFRRDK